MLLHPQPKQQLIKHPNHLLHYHPALQFNWHSSSVGSQVFIIDQLSFRTINQALTKELTTSISNINQAIILQSNQPSIIHYEPVLIQGLSQSASDQNLQIKVISPQANALIFTKLGCSGRQIKRKIVKEGERKIVDLYPKHILFELISAKQYHLMQKRKEKGYQSLIQPQKQKYQINYYNCQSAKQLKEKILTILNKFNPSITSKIRIYLYNPALFKSVTFERIVYSYFLKEDITNQTTEFYNLINNKQYDDFLAQTFPGTLIRNEPLTQTFKQGDKLIVQYFSQDKWMFPQQPQFSEAKKCRYCRFMAQLYLKYECCDCKSTLLYCSRVCHYLALKNHPCRAALKQLQVLYGKQNITASSRDNSTEIKNGASTIQTNSFQKQKASSTTSTTKLTPKPITVLNGTESTSIKPPSLINSTSTIKMPNIPATPIKDDMKKPSTIVLPSTSISRSFHHKGKGGIQNIGNICYLNSSIQVISRTLLTQLLLQLKTFSNNQPTLKAYSKFLSLMKESSPNNPIKYLQIEKFKDVIDNQLKQFKGFAQHDAHQFITYFLDKLHDQMNKKVALNKNNKHFIKSNQISEQIQGQNEWITYIKNNNSLITSLFYGQHLQKTQCPNCHFKNITFAPFSSLSCSIPSNFQPAQFELYHQTYKYRDKMRVVKITSLGNVLDLLKAYRNKINIPSELKYNLKLYQVSYYGPLIQYQPTDQIKTIITDCSNGSTTDKTTQKKIAIFQAPYPAPTTLAFRFNDQTGKPIAFKRPLFFKSYIYTLTNRDLYNAVRQYLFDLAKFYIKANFEQLQTKLKEKVQTFFILTVYWQGKQNQQGKVEFQTKGRTLQYTDDSIPELQRKIVQIWVTLKKPKKPKANDIQNIFHSQITNKMSKYAPDEAIKFSSDLKSYDKRLKLQDCLKEEFNKHTRLDQGNEWNCPKCQEKTRAFQSISLYKTGKYLLINIKRFNRNYDGSIFQKNNINFQAPLQLNLKDILQNPTLPQHYYSNATAQDRADLKLPETIDSSRSYSYRLQGVILHQGAISGGHYTALCQQEDEWWQFNDSKATQVNNIREKLGKSVYQERVYAMLYQRIVKQELVIVS